MGTFLGQSRALPTITVSRCSSGESRSKRPKAVIFDMGGVILPSPFKLFLEFEAQVGLPKGTVNQLIAGGGIDGPWAQLECGKLTLKQLTLALNQQLSKQVGRDIDVSPLVAKLNVSNDDVASPVMLDTIKCVRAEGLKTALLTNNWFKDELKTQTMMSLDRSLFDVVVESCVLGCRKPHVDIYTHCVDELKVNADETVFLDDIGSNLKAAHALGIRTIKVTSPEQGVAELEQVLGFPLRGFVPGTTSVPKHLLLDSNRLETYLKSVGLQDSRPANIRVFEHGQSNPTYFVSYGGRNIVLRKKPPGKLLPSAHAVDREFRVMSAAQKGGVPVPNMIAFCGDESVIGTQFYLMDFVAGRIFKDIRLLELPSASRRDAVMAMVGVLARIHAMDIDKVGLSDYGKKGKFVERNFKRWTSQYELAKTHEIPSMTKLMEWLPRHMPQDERVTVVHGDFRLDNIMYHPDRLEVTAVIDWELSTLGDPLTDLATCMLAYYMPASCPLMYGLANQDVSKMDIPTVDEIIAEYCRLRNLPAINNWDFYISFVLFRMAAILQGVYKRNISGQGSSSVGKIVGEFAETSADIGWRIASQSSLKSTIAASQTSASTPTNTRRYSTLAPHHHHQTVMSTITRLGTPGAIRAGHAGQMAVSVSGLSPRVQELHSRLKEFIQEHVVPLEAVNKKRLEDGGDKVELLPAIQETRIKAQVAGLWNLFLSSESDPDHKYGAGLTNLEYAFLCEEMGRYIIGPEVFNCSIADSGNMELLAQFGTDEQKEMWLRPLLEGRISSCLAMTEPAVVSLDASNSLSSIRRDGNQYIVNGRKWWTSGAHDPRCKLCIFMGRTDPGAATHRQQSMILIPMDLPGVTVIHPLTALGNDHKAACPGVVFENVRVPAANILLGEGQGLEIIQAWLRPHHIHHCINLVGGSERVLALLEEDSTLTGAASGKPLSVQGSLSKNIAKSKAEIRQCRLLVLRAAHMLDLYGNKVVSPDIAMIKVVATNVALAVIDRAVQAHGGAGVHDNSQLIDLFVEAHALKIAGGSDQVYMRPNARIEYAKSNHEDGVHSPKENMETEKVWLLHRAGFSEASIFKSGVTAMPEGRVLVRLECGDIIEVDEKDIEKINPPEFDNIDDLAALQTLNESSLLHILRQRYSHNLIHSQAGPYLIVIKPLLHLPIYTTKFMQLMKDCKRKDMPPHIFSMAEILYRDMLTSRTDQSLLLMGKSGSGKTVNGHHVLSYLVTMAGSVNGVITVEKIRSVFMLLAAFGNCRTSLNVTASRFTQIFTLRFDHKGHVASANVQAMMLEKSRVVRRPEDEQTFAVFYQLLAGADISIRNDLLLQNLTEANLFMTPLQKIEDKEKATEAWLKLFQAFQILNFSNGEVKAILAVLAAIYHLGNAGVMTDSSNKPKFTKSVYTQKAASLLGTTVQELNKSIFSPQGAVTLNHTPSLRATCAMDGPAYLPADPRSSPLECLEGFVVALYADLFLAVVSLINRSMTSSVSSIQSFTLVDCPGFQNSGAGSNPGQTSGATFEDLCHNYTQEKLQALFHDVVFSSPMDIYEKENISVDCDVAPSSPKSIVNLLDKPPPPQGRMRSPMENKEKMGLLWILDEEAMLPALTEDIFMKRILEDHCEHPERQDNLLRKGFIGQTFIINHNQGTTPTMYNVHGWLKFSQDNPTSKNASVILHNSKIPSIATLFSGSMGHNSKIVSRSLCGMEGLSSHCWINSASWSSPVCLMGKSVCLQAMYSVNLIIDVLKKTSIHFVHCVLPQVNTGLVGLSNPTRDDCFNVPLVRRQLRGFEILAALRFYRLSFPDWMSFPEFISKFGPLAKGRDKTVHWEGDEKLAVNQILDSLDIDKMSYRVGNLKVFFHPGCLDQLDLDRDGKFPGMVRQLQALCRGSLVRKRLGALKGNQPVNQHNEKLQADIRQNQLWQAESLEMLPVNQHSEKLQPDVRQIQSFQPETTDHDLAEKEDKVSGYKSKYEQAIKELQSTKRQLQHQHQEKMEQELLSRKQIEKLLHEAVAEAEEQRRCVQVAKMKAQRLTTEIQDIKLHLDEQISHNKELERKQKRCDNELTTIHEKIQEERAKTVKLQLERDELLSEKYFLEQSVQSTKMETQNLTEKCDKLETEMTDLLTGKHNNEVMELRRSKRELEIKLQGHEEELEDQAEQLQHLEEMKLQLETSLEKMRQQHLREMESKDEEVDDMRTRTQNKLRLLEDQLEEEYEKRKHRQERNTQLKSQLQVIDREKPLRDRESEKKLRHNLEKTKALLVDAGLALRKQKDMEAARTQISVLLNQLEEAEKTSCRALKAKKRVELEVLELQQQLEDLTRDKQKEKFLNLLQAESKNILLLRENTDLQSELNDVEDNMKEVIKKNKAAIQQQSMDQIMLIDQTAQIQDLVQARSRYQQEVGTDLVSELQARLESCGTSMVDMQKVDRLETKIRAFENRVEIEAATRQKLESQVTRVREQLERSALEKEDLNMAKISAEETNRRSQAQLRDLRVEFGRLQKREIESAQRKKELENRLRELEGKCQQHQTDLRMTRNRITDLQAALEDNLRNESCVLLDSENEGASSDGSGLNACVTRDRHRYKVLVVSSHPASLSETSNQCW